jgi:hypothetical protein
MGDEEAKPYSWLSLEPLQEGQVRCVTRFYFSKKTPVFAYSNILYISVSLSSFLIHPSFLFLIHLLS